MIVQLPQASSDYPDLTARQHYVVIGIEANDFRLLNDRGKPYLYPHEIFEVIDFHEPSDWISGIGSDGERYAYPAVLNEPGFFEDFFDGDNQTIVTFWRVVNQRLALTAHTP